MRPSLGPGRSRPFFVVATEVGRYGLFKRLALLLPGLFLVTKKRPTHAHVIMARIEQEPGIHYDGLRRGLRLGNGVLSHHLVRLERDHQIRRRRTGTHVRFYPMAVQPPPDLSLDANASRILLEIRRHPGISQSELARRLHMSRQLAHHHIKRMADWKLLAIKNAGRASHLAVVPDAVPRVRWCRHCSIAHAWQRPAPDEADCPLCRHSMGPSSAHGAA